MSEEHWDEPFLRTVAAAQAQMSLINAESDELTDLGDMQAQRKLKAELNEYVSAHSGSGIIPPNPLEVIGDRLKALSKFFSDTNSLQLELLNVGKNILSAKEFSAHHAEQVKAPKISSDYLKSVLVELSAANESLSSKLELLKLRLDPLDWVDNYPGTKLHPELPLCASVSQIAIPVDVDERANLHAFAHGAGSMHDKVKGHLEKIEKKTQELVETHESHRQTLDAVIECVDRGDYVTAPKKLNTLGAWFSDLPYIDAFEETGKLQKSCEDIISFRSNLPKACNHVLEDYRTPVNALSFGKVASKKVKDKLANLKIKLEEHDAILKSYPNSELENRCKPSLEAAHTDLAKAEVELVDLMAKGSRYRRRTWIAVSVVLIAIGLVIADQYKRYSERAAIEEAERARLAASEEGTKLFFSASASGNIKDVKHCLAVGADVNVKDLYGRTPLHRAAMRGHKEIVELLIAAGAEVNAKNKKSATPLHSTALFGHKEIAELLITKGADVNAKDKDGETPLDWAKLHRRPEIADFLRKHGAKTSFELKASQYFIAAAGFSFEAVKHGLAAGANVNATDESGWTPLHRAAMRGRKEIAKLLIAKGADVNAKDKDGLTPLHYAAMRGRKEIAELLIAEGSDVNAKDDVGDTPVDWAEENHPETAELLRKHSAKTSAELKASQN
jgi:ankyrin repeat protein